MQALFGMKSLMGGIQKVRSLWREGRWILKKRTNEQREGCQAYLYVCSKKKIAWYFKQQTEYILASSLAVAKSFAVLSLVQHIKVFFFVFLLKKRRYFFSFSAFLLTCKYFYCFFFLLTPQFFIRISLNVTEHFLRGGGGNSLKRTYVEGGYM